MTAINEVNYNGVYWKDIDWPVMDICDCCGIDGDDWVMAGHLNACRYLYKNQQTPAGRAWLLGMIEIAVKNGWRKS